MGRSGPTFVIGISECPLSSCAIRNWGFPGRHSSLVKLNVRCHFLCDQELGLSGPTFVIGKTECPLSFSVRSGTGAFRADIRH